MLQISWGDLGWVLLAAGYVLYRFGVAKGRLQEIDLERETDDDDFGSMFHEHAENHEDDDEIRDVGPVVARS